MYTLVLSATYFDNAKSADFSHENCHALYYVTSGQARITIEGRSYTAEKDTLILTSRLERCTVEITKEPYSQYKVCVSSSSPTFQDYSLLSVLFNRNAYFSHVISVGQGNGYFRSAFSELTQSPAENDRDNKLLQILIELQKLAPKAFADITQSKYQIIRQIQGRFEENFQQSFSLAQLADEFYLSTYYLSHLFKRITGYPIMKYLFCCRIEAAKQYLSQTEMSIEEIVSKCGFSDSNNFRRTFKTETGLSPTQFRKLYIK